MTGAPLTNREVENAAIELVLARERREGRRAVDARGRGGPVDIEGDRLIEVKAYGQSARGVDIWLETRQVEAALANPSRFHLMIVEHIRSPSPRLIDLHGDTLARLLERRRVKHYFEVAFPTAVYDSLTEAKET